MTSEAGDLRGEVMRFIAGDLDPAGETAIQSALASDAELRRFYADVLLQSVQLAELADKRRLGVSPSRRMTHRRTLGLGGYLVQSHRASVTTTTPTIVVTPATPSAAIRVAEARNVELRADGVVRPATAGAILGLGNELSANVDGAASIVFPDGTILSLRPGGTRVRLDSDQQVSLLSGNLDAVVAKQAPDHHFSIHTTSADIAVIGTRFSLHAGSDGTAVRVQEGRVRFTPSEGSPVREVAAGGAAASGHGLLGVYFRDEKFTDEVFRRIEGKLNFWWGRGSPDPRIGAANFSVRWSGWLLPEHDEDYTIYAISDDSGKVWVDGAVVVNNPMGHELEASEKSGANRGIVRLRKGIPARIVYEFFQIYGTSCANLEWSSPSLPKQLIPAERMRPDTGVPGASAP